MVDKPYHCISENVKLASFPLVVAVATCILWRKYTVRQCKQLHVTYTIRKVFTQYLHKSWLVVWQIGVLIV